MTDISKLHFQKLTRPQFAMLLHVADQEAPYVAKRGRGRRAADTRVLDKLRQIGLVRYLPGSIRGEELTHEGHAMLVEVARIGDRMNAKMNTKSAACSTAQRDLILRRLRACEYDLRIVSLPHHALADRAGLPKPPTGTHVDDWIGSLQVGQASDLIKALAREVGDP